jgi:DNA-binding LacI/PurR family transcriptional regulator
MASENGMKLTTTMKDVARRAGVSQPTVSNFINGTGKVSDKTADKIHAAIKELGYVPNALAKALKQKTTNTVGLIIPDIDSGFYAEIAKNIELNLRESGFLTYLCNTFYNDELERLYTSTLLQQNVAGIILGYGLVEQSMYHEILKMNIPLVIIDGSSELDTLSIPSVEIDNTKGSMLAVDHLYRVGARKICFASEPLSHRALKLRFNGFKTAMEKYGYPIEDEIIFIENVEYNKIEMGYNLGARIMLNGTIDAIYASSDTLAIGIMQRLREYEVKIPDDMVIIGYDDIPISKLVTPSLTTIMQPKYQMAEKGADILVKMIKNEEIANKDYLLEPSLIIRQSTMKKPRKE